MYRSLAAFALLILTLAAPVHAELAPGSQGPTFPAPEPNPKAVPTFHSIGLYWHGVGGAATAGTVRYRPANSGAPWKGGLDLWYDVRNSEYRGSIVELKPDTLYDIELTAGSSPVIVQATTWSESFNVPAGYTLNLVPGVKTVQVWPSNVASPTSTVVSGGLHQEIRLPMNPAGYTVFTGAAGANVIDHNADGFAGNAACITVLPGSQFLIIRGLVLANCKQRGIHVARFNPNPPPRETHSIVIEDNEIYGHGRAPNQSVEEGAIHCDHWHETINAKRPSRVVVQRNRIRDPRHSANPWSSGSHPQGPIGIQFSRCGQNNVVRYNEIYSTANPPNFFMDGIGGAENFSKEADGFLPVHSQYGAGNYQGFGFPWGDSDVYGNRVSHAYDDGIEVEGANRNVRVWGNFIDKVGIAIGAAATAVGPLYVWRNVSNILGGIKLAPPGDPDNEDRGPFIKAGAAWMDPQQTIPALNGGRAYYFHNTVLQPNIGQTHLGGAGFGINSSGGVTYNFVSRNNIWHIHRTDGFQGAAPIEALGLNPGQEATIDADQDLFNGTIVPSSVNGNIEPNRITGTPTYSARFALPSPENGWTGNFQLEENPPSLGYQAGAPIPGFNEGTNPDVGAHQSGRPPMTFGVNACFPYYSSCKP